MFGDTPKDTAALTAFQLRIIFQAEPEDLWFFVIIVSFIISMKLADFLTQPAPDTPIGINNRIQEA
jgi:hypothetical protein